MFDQTLSHGVPIKNVVMAILTGKPQGSRSKLKPVPPAPSIGYQHDPDHVAAGHEDPVAAASNSNTNVPSGQAPINPYDGIEDQSDAYKNICTAAAECLTQAQQVKESLQKTDADQLVATLFEQNSWLAEHENLLDGIALPSGSNLQHVYERCTSAAEAASQAKSSKQEKQVLKVDRLLQEGFNYLSKILLFEAMIWHAETISPALRQTIADITSDLKSYRADEKEFQTRANEAKQALAQNSDLITDRQGKKAAATIYAAILEVIGGSNAVEPDQKPAKKIKSILKTPKPVVEEDKSIKDMSTSHRPATSIATCFDGPPIYAKGSPVSEEAPELYNFHGQVVTRSAMELLEEEEAIAAKGGLYERDGVIMTASALSLLQAQEAMARADTSGQGDWGPDSWDGIRGQYVPKWTRKLTAADKWPLVDDDGKPLRNEDGTRQEDWFEPDMDKIEERNLLKFGMEGVVDRPY